VRRAERSEAAAAPPLRCLEAATRSGATGPRPGSAGAHHRSGRPIARPPAARPPTRTEQRREHLLYVFQASRPRGRLHAVSQSSARHRGLPLGGFAGTDYAIGQLTATRSLRAAPGSGGADRAMRTTLSRAVEVPGTIVGRELRRTACADTGRGTRARRAVHAPLSFFARAWSRREAKRGGSHVGLAHKPPRRHGEP
jgi:hypothetical protein